ncbi:zinc ribbon domain-containing protein [Pseudomonas aeruginosa]|uniref:zinc ribbon domain-containing protein n=1 Tax=Pseudomonas aeruginosa TaxID=287 RepID=UPI0021E32CC3|nr:zinc ribbon domain-containing protein [Pseudomonas aeruginosa]
MSSTQHQLIEQCTIRLRGIVEALDNIHETSPQRWSTDLDDVHSSAESLLALINDQAPPSEDQLIAAGLSYPLAKEDAVKLWYSGFRSEVITVLEAWEAIGHDTGINPDKEELLESLRNMAAICNAHGNDMPAQSAIDQRQVIADAITGALAFGAQASQPPAADHWLRPFYDIGRAEGQRTQELAMLVRMLASSLKRHAPESNLVARATNYLAAKGLAGTPLRDSPALVEQAGGDEREEFEAWMHTFDLPPQLDGETFADERYLEAACFGQFVYDDPLTQRCWAAWQARAALAQPSSAEARDYEEVRDRYDAAMAEVGRLRAIIRAFEGGYSYERLRSERDAANSRLHEVATACATAEQERAAALARVAELERQQPVAWMHDQPNRVDVIHRDVKDLLQRVPGSSRGIHRPLDVSEHYTIPLYAAPVAQAQHSAGYAEARQCVNCRHIGINDSAEYAACHDCRWTGPEPDEDKCPRCGRENCMVAACPECGGLYELVAEANITAPPAQAQHCVPEVSGIGRDFAYPRSVVLYLRTEPTDDDLRAIHDGLRSLAAAPGKEVPQAWLDVQAERRRQITAEGWTPDHDDLYCAAELPRAAAAYILSGANDEAPAIWPFSAKWWKPRDARANYMRAGALILAEIERLDRAAAAGKEVGHE